jgi:flagellar basal-body rod protein FlgC
MISAFGSSISGMNAAFKMMDVSAHNTANVNTDEFKAQRVTFSENKSGGVSTNVDTDDSTGAYYLAENGTIAESSNVNIAEEILNQIIARNTMDANVAAFKTADEMAQSLLDILA